MRLDTNLRASWHFEVASLPSMGLYELTSGDVDASRHVPYPWSLTSGGSSTLSGPVLPRKDLASRMS